MSSNTFGSLDALSRLPTPDTVALVEAYDVLRAAWSFRQRCALHADNEKYRWACEKFDAAFDAADQARSLLSDASPTLSENT